MKRLALSLLLLLWALAPAKAGVTCTFPFSFTSGATISSSQMNSNFSQAVTCFASAAAKGANSDITSLTGLTTPIPTTMGGAWVQISTQTASASATLDFTGLTTTYRAYCFVLTDVLPATNAVNLLVQVQTAATFRSDATYAYHVTDLESSASSYAALASATGTGIPVAPGSVNTAAAGASGTVCIYNPGGTTAIKKIGSDIGLTDGNGAVNARGFGYYNGATAANAVTGLRFLFASGNIASGTIAEYGIN